jgi:hypothetical protein
MLEILGRVAATLSHAHILVHAAQIVIKGFKFISHSNIGLLGLDRVMSHFNILS